MRFFDRTLKIALTHAEFDRDIPFVVLTVNDEGPGLHGNGRELLEWNAGSIRRVDQNIADGVHILPILRQKPNDEIEEFFTFIHLRHRLASDSSLNHSIHVGDPQAIPSAGFAINLNQQIRLSNESENPQILHSGNGMHDRFNLGGFGFHKFEIRAE